MSLFPVPTTHPPSWACPNCRFCGGNGCVGCDGEWERIKKLSPDKPVAVHHSPVYVFKLENPEDLEKVVKGKDILDHYLSKPYPNRGVADTQARIYTQFFGVKIVAVAKQD